jgi:hypothetical protein
VSTASGAKARCYAASDGTAEQAAEKVASVEENRDSSGLKPLGMTYIKDFYGAAEAAPLQNTLPTEFFSNL